MRAPLKTPTLQATAAAVLPGMRRARALLDVSIRVMEYFERHPARDASSGASTNSAPAGPSTPTEAEHVKALLEAFGRLHDRQS